MVYPNNTDKILVAEQYEGTMEHVRCVHHIKDLRTWFDFHEDTCRFIQKYPAVMNADVVKVYPASVDRLSAKRVREVILIMSEIKKRGKNVCLVIAAQWATGRQQKENIDNYKRLATTAGLVPDVDFIFTSDFEEPKFDAGIHKQFLRELMLCTNVFIFPTREESFGLVYPEAILSSAVIPMANKSLRMLGEVGGNHGLYFDFGSYHHEVHHKNASKYYADLATIILGRMRQNEAVEAKTYMRQTYNYDNLYFNEYEPLFAEAKTWK
jgi:glycosyltransferase involved in cell wall biosynthesis